MAGKLGFREGQRWGIKSTVLEFERSFVIGRVTKAGGGKNNKGATYEAYIRFSDFGRESLLPDFDGLVLGLKAEGLEHNVTSLMESEVELPWWWVYGRRMKSKNEADNSQNVHSLSRLRDELPPLFRLALQKAEIARKNERALEQHRLKFPQGTRPGPRSRTIKESWKRITAWMKKYAPEYSLRLNRGASKKSIATFESEIGVELPEDFKESWQLHDGGEGWIPARHGDFLSLERILQQWKMYKSWQESGEYANTEWAPTEAKGPIKPVFWDTKRIYLTDNSGDHLTLDLDPPKDGTYGQILHHCHEVGPTEVLAKSWSEFLQKLVNDLESGRYVYFEDVCDLEPIEWHVGQKKESL